MHRNSCRVALIRKNRISLFPSALANLGTILLHKRYKHFICIFNILLKNSKLKTQSYIHVFIFWEYDFYSSFRIDIELCWVFVSSPFCKKAIETIDYSQQLANEKSILEIAVILQLYHLFFLTAEEFLFQSAFLFEKKHTVKGRNRILFLLDCFCIICSSA